MYYQVTISYLGTAAKDTFKIDEKEIHSFLKFITEHIANLELFVVIVQTV